MTAPLSSLSSHAALTLRQVFGIITVLCAFTHVLFEAGASCILRASNAEELLVSQECMTARKQHCSLFLQACKITMIQFLLLSMPQLHTCSVSLLARLVFLSFPILVIPGVAARACCFGCVISNIRLPMICPAELYRIWRCFESCTETAGCLAW